MQIQKSAKFCLCDWKMTDQPFRTNSQQLNDAIIESSENPISMNQDNQNQTSKRKREVQCDSFKFFLLLFT
jgi:hypothetical protein